MDCGAEISFFQQYKALIPNNLVYLSVYNSPQCISLLNYEKTYLNSTDSILQNVFKLVPVDDSTEVIENYAALAQTIGFYNFQNYLNEIENYYFMSSYNHTNSTRISSVTNATVTLSCYSFSNNYEQICQRNLIFYLFNYNKAINSYQQALEFEFSLPMRIKNTSTIKSALITTINQINWPRGLKSDVSSSCSLYEGNFKLDWLIFPEK